MKKLMYVFMAGCMTVLAHADLAITNGDFQANATQTSNVTDWFDTVTTNTGNWWETTWAGPNVSPTGNSVLGLSYMWTTPNWAYQSLGTNDADWPGMTVTYDVGSFTDAGGARDLGVTVSVYESDGSFIPADNADIDGAAGVTLIDTVSTLYPAVPVGGILADQSVTLDLRTAGSGELFLRFVNYAGTMGEPWTAIDNVEIAAVNFEFDYDAPEPYADNIAIERNSPENDLVFTINDAAIAKVDVHFGPQDDPNLTDVPAYKIVSDMAVSAGSQYTITLESEWPADLDYNTAYYWKVIGYEPNTAPGATDYFLVSGPVSTFTTIPQEPEVTPVTPAYTAVDAGLADLQLTVKGYNVISYQWYKAGSPDVPLNDGADYDGTTTNTLTIYDVQLADEGYYYCYVTNSVGNAASQPGRVMTRRMTSYYPFETTTVVDGNEVTPDTIGGFDAVLLAEGGQAAPVLADANQLDAATGYYLELDNADAAADPNGQYAQVPAGVADYQDLTVSAWVHPMGGSNWGRLFDFGSADDDYLFLAPDNGNGSLHFAISTAGIGGEQVMTAAWLPWGTWSHVAVTLSGDTGRLYVNGELVATNTGITIDPLDIGAVLNYIGKSQFDEDPEFNGLIDELKIYNYARTTEQVAQDYLDVRGEYVCNNEAEPLVYDFNEDCHVNLEDFAIFVVEWLDSNRIYPD